MEMIPTILFNNKPRIDLYLEIELHFRFPISDDYFKSCETMIYVDHIVFGSTSNTEHPCCYTLNYLSLHDYDGSISQTDEHRAKMSIKYNDISDMFYTNMYSFDDVQNIVAVTDCVVYVSYGTVHDNPILSARFKKISFTNQDNRNIDIPAFAVNLAEITII